MASLVNLHLGLETGLMHEYRRFVEREMSKRQWNANQVAQHAGLQRQTVYDITQDKREVLPRPPASKTVDGLAHAFGISREKILAAVAQAMGLPVQIVRADVSTATNDELMSELSKRLKRAGDGNVDRDPTPKSRAGVSPAPEDDGLGSFGGRARGDLDHESKNDGAGDNVHELFTPPPPASETAAWETENRGRKTRQQQDEDAEGSQDPEDDDE